MNWMLSQGRSWGGSGWRGFQSSSDSRRRRRSRLLSLRFLQNNGRLCRYCSWKVLNMLNSWLTFPRSPHKSTDIRDYLFSFEISMNPLSDSIGSSSLWQAAMRSAFRSMVIRMYIYEFQSRCFCDVTMSLSRVLINIDTSACYVYGLTIMIPNLTYIITVYNFLPSLLLMH